MLVTSSSKARRDMLMRVRCGGVVVVVVVWWWRLGASRGKDLGDNETGESRRHCLSGSNQRAGGLTVPSRAGYEV